MAKAKIYDSKKKLGAPKQTFREWSKSRPDKKKMEDTVADQLFGMLQQRKESNWTMADHSGLSDGTIAKYRKRQTKRPQGLSMQMLAEAMGYEIVVRRKR